MQEVDANFEELEGSSCRHRKAIDSLEQKADHQGKFNHHIEVMMLDLQALGARGQLPSGYMVSSL